LISLANVKHQILDKHLLCFIILFVWVYGPKTSGDYRTRMPNPFLPSLLSMVCISNCCLFSKLRFILVQTTWDAQYQHESYGSNSVNMIIYSQALPQNKTLG